MIVGENTVILDKMEYTRLFQDAQKSNWVNEVKSVFLEFEPWQFGVIYFIIFELLAALIYTSQRQNRRGRELFKERRNLRREKMNAILKKEIKEIRGESRDCHELEVFESNNQETGNRRFFAV